MGNLSYKQQLQMGRATRIIPATGSHLINLAGYVGLAPSSQQSYCAALNKNDRLPRGSRECFSQLRQKMIMRWHLNARKGPPIYKGDVNFIFATGNKDPLGKNARGRRFVALESQA